MGFFFGGGGGGVDMLFVSFLLQKSCGRPTLF